jgi:hypothetical protein
MIRDFFMALLFLSLAVTVAFWLGGGPHLDVQQVEASLTR